MKTIVMAGALLSSFGAVLFAQDTGTFSQISGGGSITFGKDRNGDIESIHFAGDSDWLAAQVDTRSDWRRHKQLKRVVITHTTVDKKMLGYIATLKSVEDVEISGMETVVIGDGLAALGAMKWLKRLRVDDGGGIESKHWSFLSQLTNLEDLSLYGQSVGQVNLNLELLGKLKRLTVSGINANSVQQISHLRELESLHVWRVDSPAPLLRVLQKHSRLRRLSVSADNFTSRDLKLIEQLPPLTELLLQGKFIESVLPIASLGKSLERLTLLFDKLPESESLEAWSELSKLKMLRIELRELSSSEQWKCVSHMPNLEYLEISADVPKPKSVRFLESHACIRELHLSAFEISDEDVDFLMTIPKLQLLTVGNRLSSKWFGRAKERLQNVRLLSSR